MSTRTLKHELTATQEKLDKLKEIASEYPTLFDLDGWINCNTMLLGTITTIYYFDEGTTLEARESLARNHQFLKWMREPACVGSEEIRWIGEIDGVRFVLPDMEPRAKVAVAVTEKPSEPVLFPPF